MKHTRGPWRVEEDSIVSTAEKDMDWPVLAVITPSAWMLDNRNDREAWKHNARLIAAAPEMFKELSNVIDSFNPSDCGCDGAPDGSGACYFHKMEDSIRRVIKKAGG